MRKLIAVLCVVAMLFVMAVPALANPSISDLTQSVVAVETDAELPEGAEIIAVEADPSRYEKADVAEVVTIVNDPEAETVLMVKDVVEKLNGELADAEAYDFVTTFTDLVLSKDGKYSFDDDGKVVSAKVTLKIDALVGETDLSNYLIMLINSETGELHFIELDPESFNSETGEITVDFPCLGTFSLIQK